MELLEKDTFHLTIIGSRVSSILLQSLDNDKREKILATILQLFLSIAWNMAVTDEFYYIESDFHEPDPRDPTVRLPEKRKSLIQMVELEGLDVFYRQLNLLFHTSFEMPVPHITLWTHSTWEDKKLYGIGLYSRREFEDMNPRRV